MEPIKKKRYNKGWENLKPIKKGEVRNPNGRPTNAFCLTALVKKELESQAEKDGKPLKNKDGTPKTWAEILASAIVRQAAKGNPSALNQLWDRTDGKVPLPLEHGGPGGGKMQVVVTLNDKAKKGNGNGNGGEHNT
jgi:hypothetical protein